MRQPLRSWGRYPAHAQQPTPCYWRGSLPAQLAELAQQHGSLLPFGNGRSYGDSCLASSDAVLHLRPLNRFISADWSSGQVCAEAGMTLDELLAVAIPRGWFLAVTPGTRFVTLGGALANDVHGKNHHRRGTFGCHVQRFGLVRSDRAPLVCSRQENAAFFAATIGGLGLTGIVDWVELQLRPIASTQLEVTHVRFASLTEFFALSAEFDRGHEYTVAWIDCQARDAARGRGIFMAADHAPEGRLDVGRRSAWSMPFTPPVSGFNRLSLRLLNSAYYRSCSAGRRRSRMDYAAFFYPLDQVLHWNRVYGPRGLQQYQCAIPEDQAPDALHALLAAIAAARMGSFLAVLKRFGRVASPGLLSFPLAGSTLALDFPEQGARTAALFARLDAIVREAGGRLYPAKDAHMQAADFQASYPAWRHCEALRDPVLCSRFWQRSTLACA